MDLEGLNGTGHCILVFSVLVLLTVPISSIYLFNDWLDSHHAVLVNWFGTHRQQESEEVFWTSQVIETCEATMISRIVVCYVDSMRLAHCGRFSSWSVTRYILPSLIDHREAFQLSSMSSAFWLDVECWLWAHVEQKGAVAKRRLPEALGSQLSVNHSTTWSELQTCPIWEIV